MTRTRIAQLLGVALLASACGGTAFAQEGYYPPPDRGYGYYEGGIAYQTAQRARSYGWHDGLADGQHDRYTGHSFRPTHSDRYEDASDHGNHDGMSRDEFKRIYRDAYYRGYQRGYGAY